jgi:hypothetical protein
MLPSAAKAPHSFSKYAHNLQAEPCFEQRCMASAFAALRSLNPYAQPAPLSFVL